MYRLAFSFFRNLPTLLFDKSEVICKFSNLLTKTYQLYYFPIATSFNNLAGLYHSQGKYEEAEPLLIQALELKKQLLGENHPSIANSFNSLAFLYESQGRYEEAELLYLQALELRKRLLGENHPTTVTANLDLLSYIDCKIEKQQKMIKYAKSIFS